MIVEPACPATKRFSTDDPGISSEALSRSSRSKIVGRWAVMVALSAMVSWVTVPRLPTGICFDDAGDLQLASATLGIAHPPGYPGYATFGYLLTHIIPADPAYVVSVTCFVAGLCVLVICVWFQVSLGVCVWLGAAVTVMLAAHPRFWTNLRAPEVYMPTLALLAFSACFLLHYSRSNLRRHLVLAVLLFGVALGNRPPVLFAAPFFLIAWHVAQRHLGKNGSACWKDLVWIVPLAIAPTVYSFGYLYVRDRPDVCYNYIEIHNEETHIVPPSANGVQAKLRRAVWEISGEQFRHYMGTDWRGFVGKLRWVRTQITYEHPFTDLVVFVMLTLRIEPPSGDWYPHFDIYALSLLTLFGLVIAFRKCCVTGWLLTGLIVSCLTFVLAYQVFGQAADLLPLLFAAAVAIGVLCSKLFPAGGHWIRQVAACSLALGAAVYFIRDVPTRPLNSTGINATDFLEKLDLATFPGPAIICANWTKSVPMRYAQCVLSPRSDLHIVTSEPGLWANLTQRETDRPVFAADALDSGGLCTLEPFRNVFRLNCPKIEPGKQLPP